jgi:PAS domain S-box-containing protein
VTKTEILGAPGEIADANPKVADIRAEVADARPELADLPPRLSERENLLATIEELRISDDELRTQSAALRVSRDALNEERIRFREMFDFAPDAYLITDLYGTIRDANIAASRLLAIEPKSLVGKALPSFFEDSARKQFPHQLDRLCDESRLDDWEMWVQPRRGPKVAVSASVARSARNYLAAEYRWIIRDCTRRHRAIDEIREVVRQLEHRIATDTIQLADAYRSKDELLVSEREARHAAESANRAKSDFLALLSHEFRTPLQAIFGYTEMLERELHGPLTEAQRGDLRRIQQSQQHLLGLITGILDFARIESGQGIDVNVQPTAVNEILFNMEGLIGAQLEPKDLKYNYRCDDTSVVARVDGAKLQQIVLNLLANATKFTPFGGSIRLECQSEGETVAIRVIDTGIGIPADKLEAVFQPFVQVRQRNALPNGTGLGLAISRKLASAMCGSLTAMSDLGKGSTFTLRLRKS